MAEEVLFDGPAYCSDWKFRDQINWHKLRGTRPNGSVNPLMRGGDPWRINVLAVEIAIIRKINDPDEIAKIAKNVSNWSIGRSSPYHVRELEKVFFGQNDILIELFREGLRNSCSKRRRPVTAQPSGSTVLEDAESLFIEGVQAVIGLTKSSDGNAAFERHVEGRAANAERAARKLDNVPEFFRVNENLLARRVAAWAFVAEAYTRESDASGAERAAREIDRVPESFKVTTEFQLRRVIAWCLVAEACLPNFDPEKAEHAAKEIDSALESFRVTEEFQLRHVLAWSFVVEAYARDLDAGNAKRAAEEIDKVAGIFKSRDEFLLRRVAAWAFVAEAYARGFDPVNAEHAAEEVEKVPDAYKAGEEFQFRRAVAWAFVAEAYGRRS